MRARSAVIFAVAVAFLGGRAITSARAGEPFYTQTIVGLNCCNVTSESGDGNCTGIHNLGIAVDLCELEKDNGENKVDCFVSDKKGGTHLFCNSTRGTILTVTNCTLGDLSGGAIKGCSRLEKIQLQMTAGPNEGAGFSVKNHTLARFANVVLTDCSVDSAWEHREKEGGNATVDEVNATNETDADNRERTSFNTSAFLCAALFFRFLSAALPHEAPQFAVPHFCS
ncbi:hypothetical protein TRVL_01779 [Trypanosoma vivax]|nr:hypothetical protein TRVL_01779 [Trypanosoma vivax]